MHNQKLTRSIRAVLDTNVFISGHLSKSGASYEVIQQWKQKKFQLLLSAEIVEEITEKFGDETLRREEMAIAHAMLQEDWDSMPDDWEAK